jgi:hypothetical protein
MDKKEKKAFNARLEETQNHVVEIEKQRIVEKSKTEIMRMQVDKVPNKTKQLVQG